MSLSKLIEISAILNETTTDERIPESIRNEYNVRIKKALENTELNVQQIK